MTSLPVRLAALLGAAVLVLAGCGSSSESGGDSPGTLSPAKALAAASKQLSEEKYVSVKGAGTDTDSTTLQVDLGFAGDTTSGTITINGQELTLLRAGGTAYFKADDDFYRTTAGDSAEQTIALIAGRWVVADPADTSFGQIAAFVDKKGFFDDLLDPSSTVKAGQDKNVNGVDCRALVDDQGTLYLDKSDLKPISLVTDDDGKGTLDFTYDPIDEATAPAAAEVVDLSAAGA